ncbi:hypothetical protein M4578_25000 [Salipiger sp. P9]|uniref:hypothetical protein n=1 Tax=Salipiger pentaromativorans TaxID=2943193 RepID=UPI0021581C49|nr:hypothetical protein [Salipiger pentaromativorans]MCR8551090.1 hypothetical protein [Salipiger pentaromativorans]
MKRFLTATVLTSLLATSAFAATEAETQAIKTFLPDTPVSSLSDAQVTELFAISKSGVSDREKVTRMQAVVEGTTPVTTFSAEENALLEQYLPAEKLAMLTASQKAEALGIIRGGSDKTKIEDRLSVLGVDRQSPLTDGELARIAFFVPDANVTVLGSEQISELRAALYSGHSDSEIRDRLMDILS